MIGLISAANNKLKNLKLCLVLWGFVEETFMQGVASYVVSFIVAKLLIIHFVYPSVRPSIRQSSAVIKDRLLKFSVKIPMKFAYLVYTSFCQSV